MHLHSTTKFLRTVEDIGQLALTEVLSVQLEPYTWWKTKASINQDISVQLELAQAMMESGVKLQNRTGFCRLKFRLLKTEQRSSSHPTFKRRFMRLHIQSH